MLCACMLYGVLFFLLFLSSLLLFVFEYHRAFNDAMKIYEENLFIRRDEIEVVVESVWWISILLFCKSEWERFYDSFEDWRWMIFANSDNFWRIFLKKFERFWETTFWDFSIRWLKISIHINVWVIFIDVSLFQDFYLNFVIPPWMKLIDLISTLSECMNDRINSWILMNFFYEFN